MARAGLRVSGTLLCHAGTHRIAFPAVDVAVIDAPTLHSGRSRSARQAFGESAGASRVLLAPSGETVGVDTLEIDAEVHSVLPAPPLLERMAGGSLLGFLFVRGELWPLVRLVEFEHFLADEAGHAQDADAARDALLRFDTFARAVIASRPADAQVLICSDHGNVEDLSTRGHTHNRVAVLHFGATTPPPMHTVADVGAAALTLLGVDR